MSNKTRKRFLPVVLVMAVAAIGVVALVAALSVGSPQAVEAHGSSGGANDCDNAVTRYIHDTLYPNDPVSAAEQRSRGRRRHRRPVDCG